MNVTKILEQVKQLLLDKGWAQGYYAFDETGHTVDPYDKRACKYCLSGAIFAVTEKNVPIGGTCRDYINMALKRKGLPQDIIYFNDAKDRTKEEVLALIDDAISLSESTR